MHLAEVRRRLYSSVKKARALQACRTRSSRPHHVATQVKNTARRHSPASTLCSAAEIRGPAHAGHAFLAEAGTVIASPRAANEHGHGHGRAGRPRRRRRDAHALPRPRRVHGQGRRLRRKQGRRPLERGQQLDAADAGAGAQGPRRARAGGAQALAEEEEGRLRVRGRRGGVRIRGGRRGRRGRGRGRRGAGAEAAPRQGGRGARAPVDARAEERRRLRRRFFCEEVEPVRRRDGRAQRLGPGARR